MQEGLKGRPYREHQERNWRHDKKRPRRTEVNINEDLGRSRHVTKISLPKGTTKTERDIPKTLSGNWKDIWNHVIRVRYSKLQDRYYLYDRQDNYLGELSRTDLYSLGFAVFSNIGAFREEIHKEKLNPKTGKRSGRPWIVHILKSKSQFKRENT